MKIRISNQILQYGAVIKVSKVYGKLFRYLKLTTFADFFHVLSSFLVSKTERGVLYTKKNLTSMHAQDTLYHWIVRNSLLDFFFFLCRVPILAI